MTLFFMYMFYKYNIAVFLKFISPEYYNKHVHVHTIYIIHVIYMLSLCTVVADLRSGYAIH